MAEKEGTQTPHSERIWICKQCTMNVFNFLRCLVLFGIFYESSIHTCTLYSPPACDCKSETKERIRVLFNVCEMRSNSVLHRCIKIFLFSTFAYQCEWEKVIFIVNQIFHNSLKLWHFCNKLAMSVNVSTSFLVIFLTEFEFEILRFTALLTFDYQMVNGKT